MGALAEWIVIEQDLWGNGIKPLCYETSLYFDRDTAGRAVAWLLNEDDEELGMLLS